MLGHAIGFVGKQTQPNNGNLGPATRIFGTLRKEDKKHGRNRSCRLFSRPCGCGARARAYCSSAIYRKHPQPNGRTLRRPLRPPARSQCVAPCLRGASASRRTAGIVLLNYSTALDLQATELCVGLVEAQRRQCSPLSVAASQFGVFSRRRPSPRKYQTAVRGHFILCSADLAFYASNTVTIGCRKPQLVRRPAFEARETHVRHACVAAG